MVTGLYWRDNKDGNGFKPMTNPKQTDHDFQNHGTMTLYGDRVVLKVWCSKCGLDTFEENLSVDLQFLNESGYFGDCPNCFEGEEDDD
jgi:hypothetical protein